MVPERQAREWGSWAGKGGKPSKGVISGKIQLQWNLARKLHLQVDRGFIARGVGFHSTPYHQLLAKGFPGQVGEHA